MLNEIWMWLVLRFQLRLLRFLAVARNDERSTSNVFDLT